MEAIGWPSAIQINAYLGTGEKSASGEFSEDAKRWPLRNAPPRVRAFLRPPPPANERDWTSSAVGWGVVAADADTLTNEQRITGSDLPEPIQALIKDRGNAPVFRYRPGWEQRFRLLRSYSNEVDVAIGQSPEGLGKESIPRYLLIVGKPDQIPWELQYVLNAYYDVGRLALEGGALENYVAALRTQWSGATAKPANSLVWSVNQGAADITGLMRNAIGSAIHDKLSEDTDLKAGAKFLDGPGQATARGLVAALAADRPGLVVTTSHGQTYPLDNLKLLSDGLGLLVDQEFASVQVADLLGAWQPDGAIWYAHACCSAGSSNQTLFEGLTQDGSEVDRILKGVAALGSHVAPLPMALLGAKKPARAFVGHVEPTFDWTLRNPDTRQLLTGSIQEALYNELYQPSPIGHALRKCYERLGALYASYDAASVQFGRGEDTRDTMLKSLLAARDVQSMVLLGDPTAGLAG
jgi:hypothetical protein